MTFTTLAHIVPAAARRNPTGTAIAAGAQALTWAELDEATCGVARALAEAGVGPGDRVAIVLRRSIASMVAVHGVLRCGAAYVPIDADTPVARRERIAELCTPAAVLTEPGQAGRVEMLAPVVLGLDSPLDELRATAPPDVEINASDDAYIIFTSGSTGEPKGIVHTHGSGLAYGEGAALLYELSPADRVAFTNALHFDMSTFELFSAPIAGAAVAVVTEIEMRFPVEFARVLAEQAVTVVFTVPFALVSLLERSNLADFDHRALRLVMFGGELFEPAGMAGLMAHWPGVRFSNSYGPAEVNQCTVAFFDAPPPTDEILSIGTAAHGASLRVAPVGSDRPEQDEVDAGELWVASPTQMRDYADGDQSRLTEHDGERWYRTGDLVERRGDELVFVGRADNQVKVRGFRVELEAVEHALCQHDAISVAVAAVASDHQLVAAVLPRADRVVEARVLLRGLAEELPSHFVPGRLEIVDSLPQGSTGKVDRRLVREHLATGTPIASEEMS